MGILPLKFKARILAIGTWFALLLILLVNQSVLVYAQKVANENDLVFDAQGLKSSPTTKDFQINGKVWNEICPSNQCEIEGDGYSSFIETPDSGVTPPSIGLSLDFFVHDNITKNLTPLQKEPAERYVLAFSCNVNSEKDIIQQGNNATFNCSGNSFLQKQNFTDSDSTYFFKTEGTYNNQSDAIVATGQFDRKI